MFPGAKDARRGDTPPADVVDTCRFADDRDESPRSSSANALALPVEVVSMLDQQDSGYAVRGMGLKENAE